jgi:hypothetical protein
VSDEAAVLGNTLGKRQNLLKVQLQCRWHCNTTESE